MNKVIIKGNLVADPEARQVGQNKTDLSKFRVAVNDFKKTVYVDVEAWEKTAANCNKYLKKGSPILIDGRLNLDEWETEGKKRSRLTVVANNVEFLGKLNGDDTSSDKRENKSVEDDDDIPF
jgi:single-strand DNA-binding protein